MLLLPQLLNILELVARTKTRLTPTRTNSRKKYGFIFVFFILIILRLFGALKGWWVKWKLSVGEVHKLKVRCSSANSLDTQAQNHQKMYCGCNSWHQLCWCCKDADYLCLRSKIIQIECTQLRTSNVEQDIIKITYDTIVLWLHTTIKRTYNVIVSKVNHRKMPIHILKIPSFTKRNQWANCSN